MLFVNTRTLLHLLSLLSLTSVNIASGRGIFHTVHDVQGLIALSNDVNDGVANYSGTTVLLDSDIVFTKELSEQFNPIGGGTNKYFRGTFNGQGHAIKNLEMFSSRKAIGLFGLAKSAVIRNVVVDSSCSIKGTFNGTGGKNDYYTTFGGIVGYCGSGNDGPCIVENSVNMADLTYVDSGKVPYLVFMGGMAGDYEPGIYDVYIRNCANYGTISQEGQYMYASIGGIAGTCTSEGATKKRYFQNCANYGAIIHKGATVDSDGYGGIGGILAMSQDINVLENCLSAGAITAVTTIKYVGAIVGEGSETANHISHCLWTSSVGNYKACDYGDTTDVTDTSLVELSASVVEGLSSRAAGNKWNKWLHNPHQSAVAFNINGTNFVSSSAQAILLPDLAADGDGKVFRGWFADRSCDALLDPLSVGDGGAVLYGGWEYSVTFDVAGGDPVQPTRKSVIYKQLYGSLPAPAREGHTFAGWFADNTEITSESVVSVAEDHSIYAKWTVNQYNITFFFNNGTEPEVRTLDFNEEIVYPENVLKTGYTFDEWANKFERMPAKNIITMAMWTANEYNVTFDVNGGNTLPESESSKQVVYDSIYDELPKASRTGYTFTGWFTEKDGGEKVGLATKVKITEDQTLYAHWSINQYTITFEANGGSDCEEIKQDYNTQIELPKPSKTGYTFAYWCSDIDLANEYTETTMPAENKTLYAKWNINQYTLTFVFNNETEDEVRTLDYNAPIVYPENVLKTGYIFDKWDSIIEFMPADNITITAQWTANEYTVTFDVNGGNPLSGPESSKQVTYDNTYGGLPEANRTGYSFGGWYTDKTFATKITSESIVSIPNSLTLYAYWVSPFVEIVFGSKDMKESDATKFIKAYTGNNFVIERFESGPSGGTRVIIKFTDEQEAIRFVRDTASMSSSGDQLFRVVGFSAIDGSSSSVGVSPLFSFIVVVAGLVFALL